MIRLQYFSDLVKFEALYATRSQKLMIIRVAISLFGAIYWTACNYNWYCTCYTVASSFTHQYFIRLISIASLLSGKIHFNWRGIDWTLQNQISIQSICVHIEQYEIQISAFSVITIDRFSFFLSKKKIAIWTMICNSIFDYKEFQSRLTMWIVPALCLLSLNIEPKYAFFLLSFSQSDHD